METVQCSHFHNVLEAGKRNYMHVYVIPELQVVQPGLNFV